MLSSLFHGARMIFAAAVVLAIPAYAVFAVAPGIMSSPANVVLAAEDDPIRNGLSILNRPAGSAENPPNPTIPILSCSPISSSPAAANYAIWLQSIAISTPR